MARVSQIRRMMQMATPHQETVTDDDVASFATDFPAPAMVKAEFSPVQDLHGYDHPWPAGGGKNLLNPETVISGKALNGGNGSVSDSVNCKVTDYIDVNSSANYTYSNSDPSPAQVASIYICFYDSNKGFLSSVYYTAGSNKSFTTHASAAFVRITIDKNATNLQLESGSTATTYAPYSNVCPISGWTGADVMRTGKNLFDVSKTYGHVAGTETFVVTGGGYYKDFYTNDTGASAKIPAALIDDLPRLSAGSYVVSWTGGSGISVYSVDDSGTATKIKGGVQSGGTFTLGEATRITFRREESSTDVTYSNFQLELGSTASAYEAYHGQTIAVDWEDEAGTQYGGYVQLNEDGSGVLVGTHGYFAVSSDSTVKFSSSKSGFNIFNIRINDIMLFPNPNTTEKLIALGYKSSAFVPARDSALYRFRPNNAAEPNLIVVGLPEDITTDEQGKAYLIDHQVTFCYPLKTPITYPLSADQIKTLLGTNDVWSDLNGDVTVRFFKHG